MLSSTDDLEFDGLFDLNYHSRSESAAVPINDGRAIDISPIEEHQDRDKSDPTLASIAGQSPPTIFDLIEDIGMTNRRPPTQLGIRDGNLERLASAYLSNGPLPTMYTPVLENRPIVQTPTTMPSTTIDNIDVQPILDDDEPNDVMEHGLEVCQEEVDVKPDVANNHHNHASTSSSTSSVIINSRETQEHINMRVLTNADRRAGGGPMRRLRKQRDIYTPDSTIDSDDRGSTATPGSKKRPYRIRPEEERDDKWRDKRDRNNASVQKSRQKAKDAQRQRDDELDYLKRDNNRLRTENESLKEQVKFLQELKNLRR